jgi:hypothetical protein
MHSNYDIIDDLVLSQICSSTNLFLGGEILLLIVVMEEEDWRWTCGRRNETDHALNRPLHSTLASKYRSNQ